jgi:hypothetical protein
VTGSVDKPCIFPVGNREHAEREWALEVHLLLRRLVGSVPGLGGRGSPGELAGGNHDHARAHRNVVDDEWIGWRALLCSRSDQT